MNFTTFMQNHTKSSLKLMQNHTNSNPLKGKTLKIQLTFFGRLKLAYHVFKNANRLQFNPIIAVEYDIPSGVYPSEADQVLRGVKLIGFDSNGKQTVKTLGI